MNLGNLRIAISIAIAIAIAMTMAMAKSMKNPNVEIISKEMIKPSQPTPSHLRSYQISSIDQHYDGFNYIRTLFFYDTPVHNNNNHVIHVLKNSLSKALTHYYPFAGKFIKDQPLIDCDDSGVEFTTAVMVDDGDYHDCFGIIENLDIDFLDKLVSKDDIVPKLDDVILAIQITQFTGGNCTVGICISHKTSDAFTLCSFLKCWSAAANIIFSGEESNFKELIRLGPILDSAPKLWPSIPGLIRPSFGIPKTEKIILKKLSFSSSSLTRLKLEMSEGEGEGEGVDVVAPTRVTSLWALLWHVIINSSSPFPLSPPASATSAADNHVLVMPVNIRRKMSPPLPENTFGNVIKVATVGTGPGSGVRYVLGLIKEALGKVDSEFAKKQGPPLDEPFTSVFSSPKLNVTPATSWCRVGFNDVDLGLSKPIWMINLVRPPINNIFLLDGPNGKGGIDVLVALPEEIMNKFLENPILLNFCDNSLTYG